jgi:phosphate-selective porin OprO and OprP
MRKKLQLTGMALFVASSCANAYDWNDWPTKFTSESGVEFGVKGLYQGDINRFSNDTLSSGASRFEGMETWRRKEFSLYAKKKGAFEVTAGYDFQSHLWLDNFLRLNTAHKGDFRVGQFKTPVGLDDGATSTSATTFLERALPEASIHQGRRIGADWAYSPNKSWWLNAAYFNGGDLNGDNDGQTYAARVIFNPIATDREVIHLGFSLSREIRNDEVARIRARPEAGLTPIRLIDTGSLIHTDHIDRWGLEGAWRNGPYLIQGEVLGIDAARGAGLNNFGGLGWYVFGSWMLTGETKPYKAGAFGNPVPVRSGGAVELAVRYSTLDLNDGLVRGGRQHDWTIGANWYITTHFKLQLNYIRATSDRGSLALDPNIVEVRAQLSF